ncbi:MAG TPA: hypothetical protein VGM25_15345 [Caulobacteraceae bacterium]|jgi:hypothetical protein
MPISIRLFMGWQPGFAISLRVRRQPRPAVAAGESERRRLRDDFSTRLSPHLARDVLPD